MEGAYHLLNEALLLCLIQSDTNNQLTVEIICLVTISTLASTLFI